MSSYTFLRATGPGAMNAAYVEPSCRPADGRYGKPKPPYQHHQFQVVTGIIPYLQTHPRALP